MLIFLLFSSWTFTIWKNFPTGGGWPNMYSRAVPRQTWRRFTWGGGREFQIFAVCKWWMTRKAKNQLSPVWVFQNSTQKISLRPSQKHLRFYSIWNHSNSSGFFVSNFRGVSTRLLIFLALDVTKTCSEEAAADVPMLPPRASKSPVMSSWSDSAIIE